MIFSHYRLITPLFIVLSLSGCSTDNLPLVNNASSMCDELKREMVFKARDENSNASTGNILAKNRARELYREYNCDGRQKES